VIYKRYFICQILKSAATVFVIAVVIFASDCAINYLAEAIAGLLPPPMVGFLVLLRVGIAFEVILPVTFFLAVILALGRLYKDSEMTAFSACGIGMPHVLKLVFILSLPVAIAAAYSSLYIRPQAWQKIYRVEDEAQNQFDISRLYPNAFLQIRSGKAVFFAEEVHDSESRAQRVFVHIADGEKRHVIRAQQMIQAEPNATGQQVLFFQNGKMYELPFKGEPGKITRFDQAQYTLPTEYPSNPRYRRKATPTEQLVGSSRLQDITELQWRLSAPLSTVLLGLLGVPLSKSKPRQGKFAKVGLAIIIFAFYFQLFVIARTWVDKAVVSPFPGIWWVPALLIGLTILLLWRTEDVFYRRIK
jgi:lipopolysaccharide export system permease protein